MPPASLLRRHRVWDVVAVGVEAQSFGSTLLTSSYVLGRADEVKEQDAPAELSHLPSLSAGNMFYVEGGDGEPKPSAPTKGSVAALPSLTKAPPALQRFREVRDRPSIDPGFVGRLTTSQPILHALRAGGELNGDHGIMFARYIGIADAVERELLCRLLWPAAPVALVDCLEVLERETCYFANVRGERVLRASVRAMLQRCAPDLHGSDGELVSAGILTSVIELYDDANVLLITTKAQKLLAVPSAQTRLVTLAARLLATHAQQEGA